MSEETPAGLFIVKKVVGLILIIIGAVIAYFSATNPPAGDVGQFVSIFIIAGVILIGIGILLVLAKTE